MWAAFCQQEAQPTLWGILKTGCPSWLTYVAGGAGSLVPWVTVRVLGCLGWKSSTLTTPSSRWAVNQIWRRSWAAQQSFYSLIHKGNHIFQPSRRSVNLRLTCSCHSMRCQVHLLAPLRNANIPNLLWMFGFFLVLFLSHNRKLAQEAWLSHPLKAMWVEGLCLATSWGRWLGIADSSLFKGDIKGHYMQLPIGYQNSLCKIPMSRNLCFNLSEQPLTGIQMKRRNGMWVVTEWWIRSL